MKEDEFNKLTLVLIDALEPLLSTAETFTDLMHDNVVFEFPYAPLGYSKQIVGRQALEEYLTELGKILRLDSVTLKERIVDQERNMAVLEFSAEAVLLSSDRNYAQDYVSVISLAQGKIVRYRDYWNPLKVLESFGSEGANDAI